MREDIAVVGVACRYPQARNAAEFWHNLRDGRTAISEIGIRQWDPDRYFAPDSAPGTINSKWVGSLAGAEYFDHAFFNISPREAVAIDPQHRLLLEESWHCVEDSGLPLPLLQSARTSVSIGLSTHDHLLRSVANGKPVDVFDGVGNYSNMAANRISYLLNLDGPSRAMDTACSSSLAALGQARADILHDDCEFALVGGVNLINSPWRYLAFTQSRMLSPDGRCFTFDHRANGYVPGEGVGVVLLTKVSTAERLGCHVYGVIKAVAANHNGQNRSVTAPSVAAQVDLIRRALKTAGVEPAQVGYVEAHGTGTSLGDPIEVEALHQAYGPQRDTPLRVGSVKTNIGHVEAGSGMAGLIKVLLMLKHRTIPPTLNREITNPIMHGAAEHIEFPSNAVDWSAGSRTAGVSSFGFGGANCHAVIEEYRRNDAATPASPVFTVAAKTREALLATLARWAEQPHSAGELCAASNQRSLKLPYRFGVRAGDLRDALARVQAGELPEPASVVTSKPEIVVLLTDSVRGGHAHREFAHEVAAAVAGRDTDSGRRHLLDRFADALGWLNALAQRGIRPAEIIAPGPAGSAAALVHSGAVTLPQAVDALLGDGHLATRMPAGCSVRAGAEHLVPNEPTADYLRRLLDERADTVESVGPYVSHAATLLDHQHTFKRAVGQWEKLLATRGIAIDTAIRRFGEPGMTFSPDELAAIALVVNVALVRVYEAWDLTPAPWLQPATHEFAMLVSRAVVDPSDAVAALFGEADLAELAAAVSEHPAVRSAPLVGFPVLRSASRERADGRRVSLGGGSPSDLAALLASAGRRSSTVVLLGDLPAQVPEGLNLVRAGDLSGMLLEIWLRGGDPDWATAGSPGLPGLPGYAFDRHQHLHGDATAHEATARPEPQPRQDRAPVELESLLCRLVAEATGVPPSAVRPDTPFADLGIDSLIIHTLTTELRTRFGDISSTLFFECRDVATLAARISRDYEIEANASPGDPPAEAVPRPSRPASPPPPPSESGIAIIGFDGRFPGADTVEEFWENLRDGRDSITEIPRSRWDHSRYFDPRRGVPEKVYAKWGGFLSDVDRFDAGFFGVAPADAMFMDPQERLFLESVRGCLEVGGYPRERLRAVHRNEVGVFAGATFNNYQLVQHEARSGAPINSQTYAIANRVSYTWDLRGPSMTLDTACSSSLYALHLACESLRRGECSLAIAGGVNLSLHPSKYQMLAQYQFLSSDGRCRAFGEGGDGYVPAETVGAFLLKPLSRARRDGDQVYGVIRGSALTHGGRTNSFTVPSPAAQTAAIDKALRQAGVDPATISYIEAHGTGTRLGDPIEIAGLRAALEPHVPPGQHCAIGSVKSNIGHGEAAAGVAQVAKVLLQLQHRALVPSLHAERTNREIDFAASPVYVQRTFAPWDPVEMGFGDVPRRAGVTSIGAGGTNVHLVMEEA
jgi:acyl transferase domain-containing protein